RVFRDHGRMRVYAQRIMKIAVVARKPFRQDVDIIDYRHAITCDVDKPYLSPVRTGLPGLLESVVCDDVTVVGKQARVSTGRLYPRHCVQVPAVMPDLHELQLPPVKFE